MSAADIVLLSDPLAGHALRLTFYRLADRVGHRLELVAGDDALPVLESCEGNDQQVWPPSPALQSLHVEQREQGPLALLVGMSGTSHWSASAERAPERAALLFDIACRVKQPPERLHSSYHLRNVVTAERQADGLLLQLADSSLRIVAQALPVEEEGSASAGQVELPADGSPVTIGPSLPVTWSLPATVRWRYRFELIE